MFEKITVFDVETPDSQNSRICSIGITRIENGEIIGSENFLIDPECEFNHINMRINHIHPEDVLGKPTFPEFWENYGAYFEDGIVAGYNISASDLPTLRKTMNAYGINIEPFNYIDIYPVVKDIYPDLPNLQLPTLCESMGISLDHHNSESDSYATAQLLLNILADYSEDELSHIYLKTFYLNPKENDGGAKVSPETKAWVSLKNHIEHMNSSGEVDFTNLQDYIQKNCMILEGIYSFDKINAKINNILENGEVLPLEEFTKFCKGVFDPVGEFPSTFDGILDGKQVVHTGDFAIGSTSQVKTLLSARGAIVQRSVTKKTDMVIVGKYGSKNWKLETFGEKVENAIKLNDKGYNIQILKEEDVFK